MRNHKRIVGNLNYANSCAQHGCLKNIIGSHHSILIYHQLCVDKPQPNCFRQNKKYNHQYKVYLNHSGKGLVNQFFIINTQCISNEPRGSSRKRITQYIEQNNETANKIKQSIVGNSKRNKHHARGKKTNAHDDEHSHI